MPRKNTRLINGEPVSDKLVSKAVKRHLEDGEPVVALAKEYGVSRATLYNWIAAYERQLLDQAAKQGMSSQDAEVSDKRTLIAELQALRLENQKLRNKVVALMIKAGDI